MSKQTSQLPVITGSPKVLRHPANAYANRIDCPNVDKCRDDYGKEVTGKHSHGCLSRPGAGYLERKASGEIVYHTPWLRAGARKPFTMAQLKPRTEKADKLVSRLQKDIDKDRHEHSGRGLGDGTYMLSTDGHRALIVKGEGERPVLAHRLFDLAKSKAAVIRDSEFHLAVKRALVMTDASRKVKLICRSGVLTVTSLNAVKGEMGEFSETVQVESGHDWHVAVDGRYLEVALGVWPLRVWWQDEERALVFEDLAGTWKYVLMPMRDEWTKQELGGR